MSRISLKDLLPSPCIILKKLGVRRTEASGLDDLLGLREIGKAVMPCRDWTSSGVEQMQLISAEGLYLRIFRMIACKVHSLPIFIVPKFPNKLILSLTELLLAMRYAPILPVA
jgi:hypothetical protein